MSRAGAAAHLERVADVVAGLDADAVALAEVEDCATLRRLVAALDARGAGPFAGFLVPVRAAPVYISRTGGPNPARWTAGVPALMWSRVWVRESCRLCHAAITAYAWLIFRRRGPQRRDPGSRMQGCRDAGW